MNHYPHHIGDYTRDTVHLTMLQHGAYRLMMDLYYGSEKPLPKDRKRLHILLRCTSKADRAAADTVLEEFFREGADGWHHKRCDEELAKAAEKAEETLGRRENEKERQRRHRERRKKLFAELKGYGIVPPWDTANDALQAILSRVTKQEQSRNDNANVTGDVTPDITANQEPIANSQEPVKALLAPPVDNSTRRGRVSAQLRAAGVSVTSQNPLLVAWVDELQATDAQLEEAVERARLHKPKPEPIPAKYLDAVLRDVCQPKPPRVNGNGAHGGGAWWTSAESMERKARELGISGARPGEERPQFYERISAEIERRKGAP